MPAAAVTCTFTNTRATNSVTLTKSWANAVTGDTTTLVIFGDQVSSAVDGTSTAPSTTTDATATASVGSTVNLSETLGGGNVGVYTASFACTANGNPVPVTQIVGSFTMPNAPVTCTVTNTAASAPTPTISLTNSTPAASVNPGGGDDRVHGHRHQRRAGRREQYRDLACHLDGALAHPVVVVGVRNQAHGHPVVAQVNVRLVVLSAGPLAHLLPEPCACCERSGPKVHARAIADARQSSAPSDSWNCFGLIRSIMRASLSTPEAAGTVA